MSVEEIRASLGADSLGYLSVDGMVAASGQPDSELCTACFTGDYPIAPPTEGATMGTLPISRVPSVYRRRRDDVPGAENAPGTTVLAITRPDLANGSPATIPGAPTPAKGAIR